MSPVDPKPVPPADAAVPADKAQRSGEGAATALQALIRKRQQVENHDDPPPQPQPPAPLP